MKRQVVIVTIAMIATSMSCAMSVKSPRGDVRESVDMDFDWKFIRGDQPGAEKVKYDDSQWQQVTVPHEWSIFGPFDRKFDVPLKDYTKWVRWTKDGAQGFLPRGMGWYRKTFEVPAGNKGKKVFIEFDGVYRNSDVWINGHHLGNHISGYVSFVYDITEHLNYGCENVIAVKVDGRKKEEWWYQGCGIYQHVRLLVTDKLHVDKWGQWVTTPKVLPGKALVNIQTEVKNEYDSSAKCRLGTVIYDAQDKAVAKNEVTVKVPAGNVRVVDRQFNVKDPVLWDLDNPYLYKAVTRIIKSGKVVDEYSTTFGVRVMDFDADMGFFLNGRSVKIKGADEHDDYAGVGTAVPQRIHIRRVEELKNAGVNWIRASAHTFSEEIYEAADRVGMLLSQETRYYDDSEWGLQMLRDVMKQSRNHPSINLWALGNEEAIEGTPEGTARLRNMHKVAKEMDPAGFTYILFAHNFNKAGYGDVTDVLGCNYRGIADLDDDHVKYPDRRMFISEGGFNEVFWGEVMARDWLAGHGMWSGSAYKGELNWPSNSWPGHIFTMDAWPAHNYYCVKKSFSGIDEKPAPTSKESPTQLVLQPDRTVINSDGQDVSVVYVSLRDAGGLIVSDPFWDDETYDSRYQMSRHDQKITFEVEGDGELVGVCNGNQYTHETDKQNWRSTYMGKCTVVVGSTRKAGSFTLKAKSESGLVAEAKFTTKPGISLYRSLPEVEKKPYVKGSGKAVEFGKLELSNDTIKANQIIEVSCDITNYNILHPVFAKLYVDGEFVREKRFTVARGGRRMVKVATDKMYAEGKHKIKCDMVVCGEVLNTQQATCTVAHTAAVFEYKTFDMADYAYPGDKVEIKAVVKNIGSVNANKPLILYIDDKEVARKAVRAAPGLDKEVSFDFVAGNNAAYRVKFNGSETRELSVLKAFSMDKGGVEVHGSPKVVKGVIGGAIKLDGRNDYLKISPIDINRKRFSVTAWIKIDAFDRQLQAPLFGGGVGEYYKGLHAGFRNEKPFMGFWGDDAYAECPIMRTGKWYFVSYVLDYITQPGVDLNLQEAYRIKKHLYLDGKPVGEQGSKFYQATLDYIGTFWGQSDTKFNGCIDEFCVYDFALTDKQVAMLYGDSTAIKQRPVLWLNFDEGYQLDDSSNLISSEDFIATASSESPWGTPVENIFKGVNQLGRHSNLHGDMWLSGNGKFPQCVKIDLGKVYTLNAMDIWNFNQGGWTMRAAEEIDILYGGENDPDNGGKFKAAGWTKAVSAVLNRPRGENGYDKPDRVELGKVKTRWVAILLNSAHGNSGNNDVGLSAVRFYE